MSKQSFLTDIAKIKSQAKYVDFGYGQVEPNHLSAQRTSQIYAQLPAAADIEVLEQGQFVKYDYAANGNGIGECNFEGKGEWMLVYNEIKLYRDGQSDCEFALKADDYQARVYSPYDWENTEKEYVTKAFNGKNLPEDPYDSDPKSHASADTTGFGPIEKITASADPYELNYNEDPFHKLGVYQEKMMGTTSSMFPRVFKTNVGDIMTTNTINETELAINDFLTPGATGILAKAGAGTETPTPGVMVWQVVKLYTMPDGQKGAKIMRIQ